MEKLTEFLDKLETLGEIVPKLDQLSGWVYWLVSVAVRIGPVCILALGLIYLLIPPNEANRSFGYRTYFGMGSIMAWRFTQRIAGILMIPIGLLLALSANKAVHSFAAMDLMQMGYTAFALIKKQVIWVLVIWVFMTLLTAVMFDRKGDCRFSGLPRTKLGKWLFKETSLWVKDKAPVPEQEVPAAPEEDPGMELYQ